MNMYVTNFKRSDTLTEHDCKWCTMSHSTHTLSGILYFKNITQFHGMHINVISSTHTQKRAAFPLPIFMKLAHSQQHYMQSSHTKFCHIRQHMWKVWIVVNLHAFHCTDFHKCSMELLGYFPYHSRQ